MNKLLLATLILVFSSCQNEIKKYLKESKEQKIERLGYDFDKDRYIDSIISTKPNKVKKIKGKLSLYYNEIHIEIFYFEFIPYEQKEEWSFYCKGFSGNDIIIQSPLSLPEHNISPKTLDKLKQIYFTIK